MHHLPTAGTSPQRTFRSISFTSSSEWVMISCMGLACLHPSERSSVTISEEKSAFPFSSPLVSHFLRSTVFLLSLSSFAGVTVLLLSLIISHRTSSPAQSNRVSSALATVSHYHVPAGMRGNVFICRRCEAGLCVTRSDTALLLRYDATFISVKGFLNGSNLEPFWEMIAHD